ncbi:hypothetical protein D3C72_2012320 [compost metagenome]
MIFVFNGTRKYSAYDGYRPDHILKDNCVTTGVQHYYDVTEVAPDGKAKGTITFLMPEACPKCLWVGKKINIQEGEKVVGYATIIKIFNPILNKLK